ncbi:MAG: hypothetical protein B6I28_02635 [Fusobacteriia bacterium 4572_132]|nr:MAG: hypothetical protein B6I28_02635 [Fusobacteriia bacterium 4572_132]
MKKSLLVLIVMVLGISLFGNEETVNLGDVTVTAERFETTTRNVPKNISIITESEIQKSGAASVMEALEKVTGLIVRDYAGNGKKVSVDLRGYGETSVSNTVVLIDGIKINSLDLSGADFASINLNDVSRIEIIPAGGAVIYGDGATGGVINIVTKKMEQTGVSGRIFFESGNYKQRNYGTNLLFGTKNIDIDFGYFNKKTDGYRKNSDFEGENISLNTTFEVNNENEIELNIKSHNDEYGVPGPLTKEELTKDRTDSNTPDDFGKTKENAYNFIYKGNILDRKLKLILKASLREREVDSGITSSWGYSERKDETKQISINPNIKYQYTSKSNFIFGYDYLDGTVETTYKGSDPTKYNKKANGYYFYNKIGIKNLELIQGYRSEKDEYKRNSEITEDYKNEAVELSLNYLYSNTGNIYFNYTDGFRTPSTDEQYNKGLKAQKSKTIELGIKEYMFYSNLNLTIYKTETQDEIYYNPFAGWGANENFKGKNERIGYEVSAQQFLGKINLEENFTFVDTKIKDGEYKGNEIPMVPKINYNLLANYSIIEGLDVTGVYKYVGEQYSISDWNNKLDKLESYSVVDLTTNYNISKLNLDIYGGIKNLLDKKYSEYSTYGVNYYPSPERNYYMGMKYNF